jgi:D-alanyl-D-alanine carboxypeptidase (penicillin-binding protein 5/6)
MRRYLAFSSLLIFCITFFLQPAMAASGAQQSATSPETIKKSKKTASSVAAKKKASAKVAAQIQAAAKAPAKKQEIVKTQQTPPQKTGAAPKQIAKATQASAPCKVAAPKARVGKRTAARATAAARTAAHRPQAARNAARGAAVAAAVDAENDTLPDIAKQISSRSVMVMDAGTGAVIFAKAADTPRQPASTIKIVTAMIALKSLGNNDVVNVSRHAADMPSSKISLDVGKSYIANDLINAVLLASANDAAVALGEKIAGSEEKFANLMTLSARMWGAQNTVCRTANGLTADGQQSTARDLANLFRYAMQHDEFARRMRERAIATSFGKILRNHNKALWRLNGAVGGKTGYTVAARQTYVGQFAREGQTIVVAIMGSESMWADLEKLVNYGFKKKKEEQVALAAPHVPESDPPRIN